MNTKDSVLNLDAFDTVIFDDMREQSSVIDNLAEQSTGLTKDTMLSLFKQEPQIREGAAEPNKRIIESLHALPEFQDLRTITCLDIVTSALGTARLAPDLIKTMQEYEKQQEENGHEPGSDEEKAASESFFDQARRKLRKAAREAGEDVENWTESCANFGISTGDLQKLPVGQKLELAEKFKKSPALKSLIDLVGKMRNFAQAATEQRTSHGADEIIDVTIGGELSRLLPVELAKFKYQRALFAKDFLERNLLNYNLQGTDKLGRGPIIMLIDTSMSMRMDGRDTWAKALAMATLLIAEKQKRTVHVLLFDIAVKVEFRFEDGKASIQDKLDLASYESLGGGTKFFEPIMTAFERRMEKELKPADILMLTDGECNLSDTQMEQVKKLKLETNTRLHTVYIQVDESYDLSKVSDSVVNLQQLAADKASPLFTAISN